MDERVKTMWVNALLSEKYPQTIGVLKDEDGYCCLGVLCDLHRKETGGKWESGGDGRRSTYLDSTFTLPGEVSRWAGLKSDSQISSVDKLVELNDTGTPFDHIASVIKEEF